MISYLHVEKAFLRFHIVNHHHASIQIVHFGKQLKFQRPTKSTEKLISMKCKISMQIIYIHAWVAASRDSVRKWSKKCARFRFEWKICLECKWSDDILSFRLFVPFSFIGASWFSSLLICLDGKNAAVERTRFIFQKVECLLLTLYSLDIIQ